MSKRRTESGEEYYSFSLKKKILSFVLSLALIFTSMEVIQFMDSDNKVYAADNTKDITDQVREQIVEEALKLVGYQYTPEGGKRGLNLYYLDCSLFAKVTYEAVKINGQQVFSHVPGTSKGWNDVYKSIPMNTVGTITTSTYGTMTLNGSPIRVLVWDGVSPKPDSGTYDAVLRKYPISGSQTAAQAYAKYSATAKAGDIIFYDGHVSVSIGTYHTLNSSVAADATKIELIGKTLAQYVPTSNPYYNILMTNPTGNSITKELCIEYDFLQNFLLSNPTYKNILLGRNANTTLADKPEYLIPALEVDYNDDADTINLINSFNSAAAGFSLTRSVLEQQGLKGYVDSDGSLHFQRTGMIRDYSTAQSPYGFVSDVWRVEALSQDAGVAITNKFESKTGMADFIVLTLEGDEAEGSASFNAHKDYKNQDSNTTLPLTGNEFKITVENTVAPAGATKKATQTIYNNASGQFTMTTPYTFTYKKDMVGEADINECGEWIFKVTESVGTNPLPNIIYDTKTSYVKITATLDTQYKLNQTINTKVEVSNSASGPWTAYTTAADLTFSNVQTNNFVSLQVHKVDPENNGLAGITFGIYKTFNPSTGALGGKIGEITTAAGGDTPVSKVYDKITEGGSFYLKELSSTNNKVIISQNVIECNFAVSTSGSGTTLTRKVTSQTSKVYIYDNDTKTYAEGTVAEAPSVKDIKVTTNDNNKSILFTITAVNRMRTNVPVEKIFASGVDTTNVEYVTARLYQNGVAYGNPRNLSADNNWKDAWNDIPMYDEQNNAYTYTVQETHVKFKDKASATPIANTNYAVVINGTSIINYDPKTTATINVGKILSNRNFANDDQFTVSVTPLTAGDPNTAKTVTLTYADLKDGKLVEAVSLFYTYTDLGKPSANTTKTYQYQIKETANNKTASGVTTDTKTYTVDVKVTYTAASHSMATDKPNGYAQDVTNVYDATGSFSMSALKKTENFTFASGDFLFKLTSLDGAIFTDGQGKRVATIYAYCDAQGNVNFGNHTVKLTDIRAAGAVTPLTKDYRLVVIECVPTAGQTTYEGQTIKYFDTVTYDKTRYNYTLTLTDDGNGKIVTKITPAVAGTEVPTFTNKYDAKGSTNLTANKTYFYKESGAVAPLTQGEFEFTLTYNGTNTEIINAMVAAGATKVNGKAVLKATNKADGSITFAAFNLTSLNTVGDHSFTLKETKGNRSDVDYDATAHELTLRVADPDAAKPVAQKRGILTATWLEGGITYVSATFKNTTAPTGKVVVNAFKVLQNKDLPENEFTFVLHSTDGLFADITAKNKADGTVTFATLNANDKWLGSHKVTITEVNNSVEFPYYTFDTHTVTLTIVGTVNATDKSKIDLVVVNGSNVEYDYKNDAKFVNTYDATGTFSLETLKKVEHFDLHANDFVFKVNASGAILTGTDNNRTSNIFAYNDATGKVDFGTHTIKLSDIRKGTETNLSKTYTLIMVEKIPTSASLEEIEQSGLFAKKIPYVIYDTRRYEGTVTFTDDGKGHITASPITWKISGTTTEVTNPEFVNKYSTSGSASIEAVKQYVTLNDSETAIPLKANQFKFDLTYTENNADMIAIITALGGKNKTLTVGNAVDGSIVFPTMNFNDIKYVGSYKFTLSEQNLGASFVEYDGKVVNLTLTITDDKQGHLTCTWTEGNQTYKPVTFINYYKASGSYTVKAFKKFDIGYTMKENEFTFTLTDADGKVVSTAKNKADGTITFNTLTLTQKDLGADGTVTFTLYISEKDESSQFSWIGYDDKKVPVTVTAKLNTAYDGKIDITLSNENGAEYDYVDDATFINTYHTKGQFEVKVDKKYQYNGFNFDFVLNSADPIFNGATSKNLTVSSNTTGSFGTFTVDESMLDPDTLTAEYTFTVKEVKPQNALWYVIYDTTVHTYTLKIYDSAEHNGHLVCEITEGTTTTTNTVTSSFVNKYDTKGSIQLLGTKVYTYASDATKKVALTDGQFTFTATYLGTNEKMLAAIAAAGGVNGVLTTTNDKNGNITFPKIAIEGLDMQGDFEFEIAETSGSATFINYDATKFIVVANVTDDTEGMLITKFSNKGSDASYKVPSFHNEYKATGEFVINAFKTYTGTLEAGKFTFLLNNKEGSDLLTNTLTAKNTADGKVVFETIKVTEANVGTFVLVVTEQNDGVSYIDYDENAYEVTVTIIDNGDGTLSCELTNKDGIEWEPKDAEFINNYHATGEFQISVKKEYPFELYDGQFSFILESDEDLFNALNERTLVITKDGTVTSPKYTLNEEYIGTHTFTVREIKPENAPAYVIYDTTVHTITLTVTDNQDGTLNCKLSEDAISAGAGITSVTFINNYTTTGSVTISGEKVLVQKNDTSVEVPFEAGDFEFTLTYNGDKAEMLAAIAAAGGNGKTLTTTVNADKTFAFPTLTLTGLDAQGEYSFTIKETKGDATFIEYDDTEFEILVTFKDNEAGKLVATLNSVDENGKTVPYARPIFNNLYTVETSVVIDVFKNYKDGDELTGGEFTFELKEGNTVISTATNDADGKVTFNEITYNESQTGTYTYTVSEIDGKVSFIEYDEKVLTVIVTVTDDKKGHITAAVTGDDNTEWDVVDKEFINTFKPTGTFTVNALKEMNFGLTEGLFEFILESNDAIFNGAISATAKNKADGTVNFGEFIMTKDLLGEDLAEKSYYFTIREIKPADAPDYIIYDESVYQMMITMSAEKKDGKYTGKIVYDLFRYNEETESYEVADENGNTFNDSAATFVNTYDAQGIIAIYGTKKLVKKNDTDKVIALTKDQFQFVLEYLGTNEKMLAAITAAGGENGKFVVGNNEDGTFTFPTIALMGIDMVGSYDFRVSEVKGDVAFIGYDDTTFDFTIVITREDGDLLVDLGADYIVPNFTNTYTAESEFSIDALKTYENGTLVGGEFEFVLTDETGKLFSELIAKNDKDGKVVFETVKVNESQVGTYVLTISETQGAATFIKYDESTYKVTVTITDNGDGTLTITKENADGIEWTDKDAEFINKETAKGEVTIDVFKNFPYALLGGEFTFVLKDADGNVVDTAKNDKDGKVTFKTLKYTEEDMNKVYTFTIEEEAGNVEWINYDDAKITVEIAIVSMAEGKLEIEVTSDGKQYEPKEFINDVQRFDLVISKIDKDTKEYLAGAEFDVMDATGEVIAHVVTDENGQASVEKLMKGAYINGEYVKASYTVVETKAPAGYVLDPTPIEVPFDGNTIESHVTKENAKQKQRIGIVKMGEMPVGVDVVETPYGNLTSIVYGEAFLHGAVFGIYSDKDCTIEVTTITTGEGDYDEKLGITWSEDLDLGTYYVKEISTPAGYIIDETIYDITLVGDESGSSVVIDQSGMSKYLNKAAGISLEINKNGIIYNPETMEFQDETVPLPNVVFGIFNQFDIVSANGGVIVPEGSMVAMMVTNFDGLAEIKDTLPAGSYTFVELRSADGFETDPTPHEFEITKSNKDEHYVLASSEKPILNNMLYGYIMTEKRGYSANGSLLAGAGFKFIRKGDGVVFNNPNSEDGLWYTNEAGLTDRCKVPVGVWDAENRKINFYTYIIHEQNPPEHFHEAEDVEISFSYLTVGKTILATDIGTKTVIVDLPVLGLNDWIPYYGLILIAFALAMLVKKHRSNRKMRLATSTILS